MNLIEFSIACKLISVKLRNVEVPKLLPPTLLASLQHIGTPIRTPTGAMSPTEGYKQFLTQQPATTSVAPMQQPQQQFQAQPVIQNQQPLIMQAQPIIPPPAAMNIMPQQQVIMAPIPQPTMPIQAIPQQVMMAQTLPQQQMIIQQQQQQQIMANNNIVQSAPIATAAIIPQVQQQPQDVPKPPLHEQLSSGSLLDSLAQISSTAPVSGPVPAAPTPPSGNASRSMSFSEKVPSVPESPYVINFPFFKNPSI